MEPDYGSIKNVYAKKVTKDVRDILLYNFEVAKSDPRPDHDVALKGLAEFVKSDPAQLWHLFITGYASKTFAGAPVVEPPPGKPKPAKYLLADEFNTKLSEEREQRVLSQFKMLVDMKNVSYGGKGSGFKKTKVTGENPLGRSVRVLLKRDPAPEPPLEFPEFKFPNPIRSVKFWLNAFIPNTGALQVPNFTTSDPTVVKPKKNLTMVQAPPPFTKCYLTDQRTFSNSITAPARMHSEFEVFIGDPPLPMSQFHRCGQTVELDCKLATVSCKDRAKTNRMHWVVVPSKVLSHDVTVSGTLSAADPCVLAARIFGDVDVVATIQVQAYQRLVIFDGKLDPYPAFEAYISVDGGDTLTVLQLSPKPGANPTDLIGLPSVDVYAELYV